MSYENSKIARQRMCAIEHDAATRSIFLNGEASLSAALGEMRQNDTLIAPTNCQGVFGIATDGTFNIGAGNPSSARRRSV